VLKKNFFRLLLWKKKINFQTLFFGHTFSWYFIQDWYNFTYILSNIIAPVYDLGRSYGNVRSGRSSENIWKRSWKCLEIDIQNFVRTLFWGSVRGKLSVNIKMNDLETALEGHCIAQAHNFQITFYKLKLLMFLLFARNTDNLFL